MSKVLLLGGEAASLLNFRGTLIRELIRDGHVVFAAAPGIGETTADALLALGAQPLDAPLSRAKMNPLNDLRSIHALWRMMASVRPDVVIPFTIKPVIYGTIAARLAGVRNVTALVTGLGYAFVEGGENKRRVARVVATALYRLALRFVRMTLFQNPDDLRTFRDLGILAANARTDVVNGSGVDLDHFALVPLPDRPRFLMIARLLADKGVREYATAAASLRASHPEAEIVLAGPLDVSPNGIRAAELADWRQQGLDYVGVLDDVLPQVARATTVVLPSYREGTPRVVLEAMAMGRAIITTDAPGCRETVRHGINGLLVPPRDAVALADAMRLLHERPGKVIAMGFASRKMAQSRYDAVKVARDIMRHAGLN